MTTFTPILGMPEIDPNQNAKETTVNTDLAILEASINDNLTVDMSGGDVTLNATQWTTAGLLIVTNPPAAQNLIVPNTKRFIAVWNQGTQNVTVKTATPSATVIVGPSKIVLITADGSNNIRALSSGVSQLADLSDVTVASLVDQQVLMWSSTASAWINASVGATMTVKTAITSAYQLVAADQNSYYDVNSASNVNITVPNSTHEPNFPIGESVTFNQEGLGSITWVADSGVTLIYPTDVTPTTRTQFSTVTVTKVGANRWIVIGDLAP